MTGTSGHFRRLQKARFEAKAGCASAVGTLMDPAVAKICTAPSTRVRYDDDAGAHEEHSHVDASTRTTREPLAASDIVSDIAAPASAKRPRCEETMTSRSFSSASIFMVVGLFTEVLLCGLPARKIVFRKTVCSSS